MSKLKSQVRAPDYSNDFTGDISFDSDDGYYFEYSKK